MLKSIIQDYTGNELYRLASGFRAEELCGASARLDIQHNLTRYLEVHLHDLGVTLLEGSGVLIQTIRPDSKFTNTMLNIEQHQATLRTLGEYVKQHQAILEMLKEYKEAFGLIDKMMKTEFLNSLENHQEKLSRQSMLDPEALRRWREGFPELIEPSEPVRAMKLPPTGPDGDSPHRGNGHGSERYQEDLKQDGK